MSCKLLCRALSVSLLTLTVVLGCKKAAAPLTPAQAQAAMDDAFKQATPEMKSAAAEAAAAIASDPSKALLQLQGVSSSPDLSSEQRNAAQEATLVLLQKLREAAAKGDSGAEKALEVYRATK